MMSTRASVGNLPFSAAEDKLHRQSATHGEVASVSVVQDESTDHSRGSGSHLARVDLDTVVTEPQPALDARPVWKNGTLPGVMAGKRPAPSLSV
jgi:hypothetical protein